MIKRDSEWVYFDTPEEARQLFGNDRVKKGDEKMVMGSWNKYLGEGGSFFGVRPRRRPIKFLQPKDHDFQQHFL